MTGINSVRKDERGLGLVVVIVVVLVIAAIGAVGWKVTKKTDKTTTPTSSTTAATAKTVDAACLKLYNDKDLCKFATNAADFAKLAYTAVDTGTDASGATSKFTIQTDGKGSSSVTSESGGSAFSSVTIGSTSYTKLAGATSWTKYTSNATATSNPASSIKPDFSTATTPAAQQIQYKKIGKEKCGQLTCFKYQMIDPATPTTTQYAWFDTKDYRLQRWSSKGADGTNDFAITYSAVKISVPSPVTEAPSASAGTDAATQAQIKAAQDAAAAAAAQYGQ